MTNDDYIEQSQKEMMRLRKYETLVKYIAADPPELSYDKIELQRNHWKKLCEKLFEDDYNNISSDQHSDLLSDQLVDPILDHYHNMTNGQNN